MTVNLAGHESCSRRCLLGSGPACGLEQVCLEILALRHQLAVMQRRTNKRPSLRTADRFFWLMLSRWGQWPSALVIVKPETVIAWQRKGFRIVVLEEWGREVRVDLA